MGNHFNSNLIVFSRFRHTIVMNVRHWYCRTNSMAITINWYGSRLSLFYSYDFVSHFLLALSLAMTFMLRLVACCSQFACHIIVDLHIILVLHEQYLICVICCIYFIFRSLLFKCATELNRRVFTQNSGPYKRNRRRKRRCENVTYAWPV